MSRVGHDVQPAGPLAPWTALPQWSGRQQGDQRFAGIVPRASVGRESADDYRFAFGPVTVGRQTNPSQHILPHRSLVPLTARIRGISLIAVDRSAEG